jgi:transcriptional regulator with GAF, ATPase, and Fis domain
MTGEARVLGFAASVDPNAPLSDALASDRLRAVYEIGRRLLEEREPGRVVRSVLSAIVSRLEPDHACVLSLAPDGRFRALASHGLDLSGPEEQWPLSHTVLARVREAGLALLAADIASDERLVSAPSVQQLRIRSIVCVPLGRSPVRGLVYLDRRGGRSAFSKADLEFLSAVAAYASLVLERADEQLRTSEALALSGERLGVLQQELLRHQIVGRSAKLLDAYDSVRRLAAAGARVLLRGETGTGKELFARAYALSTPRAGGPYVPVPIPSLSPTLIESELFGHARGAFTEAVREKKGRLEVADGGVLFLDEVADIAPEAQVKLLRFLDSGELVRVGDTTPRRVDALLVCATNRPLEKDVAEGRLRKDLLPRLGHEVTLPPLRERREDIPLLVDHYVGVYGGRARGQAFSAEALSLLQEHDWPFNVRELQQVVERTLCLCSRATIEPDELPAYFRAGSRTSAPEPPATKIAESAPDAPRARPLRQVVEDAERRHILETIALAGGHRRRAAELLGISPDTLYRRLKDLGISAD